MNEQQFRRPPQAFGADALRPIGEQIDPQQTIGLGQFAVDVSTRSDAAPVRPMGTALQASQGFNRELLSSVISGITEPEILRGIAAGYAAMDAPVGKGVQRIFNRQAGKVGAYRPNWMKTVRSTMVHPRG